MFAPGLSYGLSKFSDDFTPFFRLKLIELKNLRQHFVDLPFFFHSAKTFSVYRHLKKKLNSMERGALFDIFARAFKHKKIKALKALRPKMTKIASRGSSLKPFLCINLDLLQDTPAL